jgi:hypothetical protein
VRATKSGLAPDEHSVAMSGDATLNFTLQEITYEGFETGDFTLLPWTFSGNAPWTITTGDFHEPTHSARGGVISHNQTTNMQVQVELASGGDVTFWYKVSSEATYDFLRFDIDGVQQQAWSGSVPWTFATFPVSAGTHTFRWRYTKDVSVNTGSDTGWVDEIVLPPLFNPATDAPNVVGTPLTFQLGRAFPNPTQGQSSIAFSVPQSGGNVDLSVFDVSGRRVRTLVSGTQAPGHHTVIWDGTDTAGNRTAAGTYFYRLSAPDFEETKKLVRLQ